MRWKDEYGTSFEGGGGGHFGDGGASDTQQIGARRASAHGYAFGHHHCAHDARAGAWRAFRYREKHI